MMYAYIRMYDGIDKNDDTYGYIGHQGPTDMLGYFFSLRSKCINDAIESLESEKMDWHRENKSLRLMAKKRAIKALRDEWKKRY